MRGARYLQGIMCADRRETRLSTDWHDAGLDGVKAGAYESFRGVGGVGGGPYVSQ